jgi:hypothetical protein
MARFFFGLLLIGGLLVCGNAQAQCQGGGGGTAAGGTTGTGTTTVDTSGATLLTGPGSLAYDMMAAQMIQQRIAQQRIALAMQQQAQRQQQLAARRARAEQTRAQIAAKRQRTYDYLAAKYGGSSARSQPVYVASYGAGGR